MSKLAKKPLLLPEGVTANQRDGVLDFAGKEGKLTIKVLQFVKVTQTGNQLQFTGENQTKQGRANLGTMASLAKNAALGVHGGYSKVLEIEGIGYKAALEKQDILLNVGLTHPVRFTPPAGVKVVLEKNMIKISGVDKFLVGSVASQIRKISPAEPYKGKGIHYQGEVVRRKAGKKVAGAGAAA